METKSFVKYVSVDGIPVVKMPWDELQINYHEVARQNAFRILKDNGVAFSGNEGIEELLELTAPFITEPASI